MSREANSMQVEISIQFGEPGGDELRIDLLSSGLTNIDEVVRDFRRLINEADLILNRVPSSDAPRIDNTN